jgi:hypothetical protein
VPNGKRGANPYAFVEERRWPGINVVALVLAVEDGVLQPDPPDVEIFLIPRELWEDPALSGALVHRLYDGDGLTSRPEFGINVAKRHMGVLRTRCAWNQVISRL